MFFSVKKLDVRIRRDSWPIRYLCRDFTWLSSPIYLGRGPFETFISNTKSWHWNQASRKSFQCIAFLSKRNPWVWSKNLASGNYLPKTLHLPILALPIFIRSTVRENAHKSRGLGGTNKVSGFANQTQICGRAHATYDERGTRSPGSTVSVYLVCFFQMILRELFRTIDQGLWGLEYS